LGNRFPKLFRQNWEFIINRQYKEGKMDTTINEFYLNKVYEDLHREQLRLMNEIKMNESNCGDKQKIITKQLSIMNTVMINCLRLRNIRNIKDQ